MIYRAILLEDVTNSSSLSWILLIDFKVIEDFLGREEFSEIRDKCGLSTGDWSAIATACRILRVRSQMTILSSLSHSCNSAN